MGNSFDHVLHIGAGLCAELPNYRAAGARAITLVEPDPETAAALTTQTAQFTDVSVIEVAVTTSTGPQRLHRFSFADLNSLRGPTGLNALFPALEELSKDPVHSKNPADLVRSLNLSDTGSHMLVLDTAGEAQSILVALDEASLLSLFQRLQICEGSKDLYEGATPLAEIRDWLANNHFDKDVQWEDADPERPILTVNLDVVGAAMDAKTTAEALAASTQQTLTETTAELEALQQTIAELTADRDQWKSGHGMVSTQLSDMTRASERHSDAQARSQQQLTLSREELLKAQGQITLISDLLLRGPAL